MRLRFDRAGGFAAPAMRRSLTLETDTLPEVEAEELRALIDSADLPGLAAQRATEPRQAKPDAFHYRVVVEDEGEKHVVEASDTDMPATLRPLLSWLARRAEFGGSS